MEKVYVVTILNSGEAVLDSDCVVRVFSDYEKAVNAFKAEKKEAEEFMKEGARYLVENGQYNDIGKAFQSIVRADNENEFVAYDDNRIYAIAVRLNKVSADNGVFATSF